MTVAAVATVALRGGSRDRLTPESSCLPPVHRFTGAVFRSVTGAKHVGDSWFEARSVSSPRGSSRSERTRGTRPSFFESGDALVEDETGLRGNHLVEIAGPLNERVETGRVGDIDNEDNIRLAGYLPGEIDRFPLRE